jgi:hypothetical protein
LAALAKMALAGLYRSSNRPADAAKIYKDLADHPSDTVSKPEAQLQLAQVYESTDPQQATNLYQQIIKEGEQPDNAGKTNAYSAAAQIAASRLAGTEKGK